MLKNLVQLNNISYIYDRSSAGIFDISFDIGQGGRYALIGPNGSGKSTLLRTIVNILHPQKGVIKYFNGEVLFKEFRQHVSYIPDTENVWDNLTCKEFIIYVCKLYNITIDANFMRKLDKWLEFFELTGRENDFLYSFSFGMKKKVQIITAFLRNPVLIILDEPVFGLDPMAVSLLFKALEEFTKTSFEISVNSNILNVQPSVLITSHQLAYVEKYATDLLMISEGKIIFADKITNIGDELNTKSFNELFIKMSGKSREYQKREQLIVQCFDHKLST